MDTVLIVIGALSAVLAFVDFLLSHWFEGNRWFHVIYVVFVCLFIALATHYSSRVARLDSVSRAADALVRSRSMDYTPRGHVFAVLAFLEKNKDLFPDTYQRAQAACVSFRCNEPNTDTDMVELSFALNGIVRGIGTLSSDQ